MFTSRNIYFLIEIRIKLINGKYCFPQFVSPPIKIPWKAITLATLLFVGGTVMLVTGSLIVSGHIDTKVK